MHTAAQKCNRHGVVNDEDYKKSVKTPEDMLPVLKSPSHHVQNDSWVDSRKMLDTSMLAYSNHVKHLTEESANHNKWLVVPRLKRSQVDHTDNGRIPAAPKESFTRPISDSLSSCNSESFKHQPKQHMNGLTDCIPTPQISEISYSRPVLDSCDSEANSFMDNSTISIVPFPPPVVEQSAPGILGESKVKDSPRKSNEGRSSRKPQFSNKNPLPPISRLKSRDSKSKLNIDLTDESNIKAKKCLPYSHPMSSQSHTKDTEGIDEVAKANSVNEEESNVLPARNVSSDDTTKLINDAPKKKDEQKQSPKKQKKLTPKVVKGDSSTKQKAEKKDMSQEKEPAIPKIKSVLKKQGSVMQMEKNVKFGEELEFVRMVTKIEYPWYNESSSSENEECQDEEEDQTSSDPSSESSSDEETKRKKRKRKRKKKKSKTKGKSSKQLIVDELETITKLSVEPDPTMLDDLNCNCHSVSSPTTKGQVIDSQDNVIDKFACDQSYVQSCSVTGDDEETDKGS